MTPTSASSASKTLEEIFEGAAAATFAIMADPAPVRGEGPVQFDFDEGDPELALAIWLNTLLAEARTHALVFGQFRLKRENSHWHGEA